VRSHAERGNEAKEIGKKIRGFSSRGELLAFFLRRYGAGRLLDDQQAHHLQHLIDRHSPEELGIASPLRSRRA
jgi:hypothetical protein